MKKQAKNNDNEVLTFIKTFLIAFVIIVAITTPAMAAVFKVGNINPGGEDVVVLEDEVELDDWVSSDSQFFDAFTSTNRVNVLLLGVNTGLTDTIMLVSFDMDVKHVDIISIPRDTFYHRSGYAGDAENKINAAYRKNPLNTALAVSEILEGIPINYYAIIDYKGIEKIVGAMGGVPMDIPFRMKYNDPYDTPPLHIDIPAGPQVLDGEHAVQFLRYRHGYKEGDLGRVKAQQQFMKNAFKQCLSFDLPKIAKTVFENIESDMTIQKALPIVKKAMGISAEDITTYMMPGYADPNPPYYVYPKKEEIVDMLTEIYSIEEKADGTTGGAVTTGAPVEE